MLIWGKGITTPTVDNRMQLYQQIWNILTNGCNWPSWWMWVTIHDCPIPYTEAQSPNMCSWTHNRYDLLSVTMHNCLLLFITCAKSLSAYTQPHFPITFKLQHIHYIHTSYRNAYRRRVKIYSSISGRPVHRWPWKGKMDIQCQKTDKVTHGSTEC